MSIEAGTPDARYAILELADGSWRVTFRHVPYDHEAMAALARQNGEPELAHPRWRRGGSGKRPGYEISATKQNGRLFAGRFTISNYRKPIRPQR